MNHQQKQTKVSKNPGTAFEPAFEQCILNLHRRLEDETESFVYFVALVWKILAGADRQAGGDK
jgi:hypothetical protein